MSTPAPSPPLPAWKPPTTLPLAGHCQVMPSALRVAPGGGVGVAATAGCAGVCSVGGSGLVVGGATVVAMGGPADADPAGATPLAVIVCVVTGPNTGAEGCGFGWVARGAVVVVVVTTVVPAATAPVGAAVAEDAFNLSTCPGWIVYGDGRLLRAASWRTSMPCAKAMLYSVSPGATV